MSSFPAPNRICGCGKPFFHGKGKKKNRTQCSRCRKGLDYKGFRGDSCELCGFVATWSGQLDVDHIDGNHFNNKPNNLQTLCANCHRLKTHLCNDHRAETENKKYVSIQIELKL